MCLGHVCRLFILSPQDFSVFILFSILKNISFCSFLKKTLDGANYTKGSLFVLTYWPDI